MSDSARPSTQTTKKRSAHGSRRSRKHVKRSKRAEDSAEVKQVEPDGKLDVKGEAMLLELIADWKKEEAMVAYYRLKANHILRLREDLHLKFMMIPDESLLDGHVNERIYYPGYESLLNAMFPEHLGFLVTQEFSPTGAYVKHPDREDVTAFYGTIRRIPVSFVAVKPRAWAYSTQKRYEADCQVRERLRDVVEYLREACPDRCPDRVYAVSALGLLVRFYYVDVGAIGDPIIIHPPPGPRYSTTLLYNEKQYDYWRLSVLDSLSVRTLRGIRDEVHKFADRIRSLNVPGPEEEKVRASKKYQELLGRHMAAMKELEGDRAQHRLLHTSDRLVPGTSRSSSPLSSLHTTVDDLAQGATPGQASTVARGAIPGQASAVARGAITGQASTVARGPITGQAPAVVRTVEDNVFFGKNLVDRDFKRLRLEVPEGRVPAYLDLFTLLGDMDIDEEEDWDPSGDSEDGGTDMDDDEDEDEDEYKD